MIIYVLFYTINPVKRVYSHVRHAICLPIFKTWVVFDWLVILSNLTQQPVRANLFLGESLNSEWIYTIPILVRMRGLIINLTCEYNNELVAFMLNNHCDKIIIRRRHYISLYILLNADI